MYVRNRKYVWHATLLLLAVVGLPGCASDGNFTLFGYSSQPNYDRSIRTVYVPIFQNRTFYRGLEFQLTQSVIEKIESIAGFKVVSDVTAADTELSGTIVTFTKNILNRNQLNEIREGETVLGCEIVWRDLRSGEILSQPKAPGSDVPVTPSLPATTGAPTLASPVPPPPPPAVNVKPLLVTSVANFVPEVGESMTSAQKRNVDRLAVQIVSMMEKPW